MRFFRYVRESLIGGSRVRRYVLYALGEILLVVIGILIAVRIDAWNEDRKEANRQVRYLARLSEDYALMLREYRGYADRQAANVEEARLGLAAVQACDDSPEAHARLDRVLLSHQVLMSFPAKEAVYKEMLTNGSLSQIANDSIKLALNNLDSMLEFGRSQVDYFRSDLGRASTIIWEFVEFYPGADGTEVRYDLKRLCASPRFKNALVEVLDSRDDYYTGLVRIRDLLDRTQRLLEEELGKVQPNLRESGTGPKT